MIKIPQNDIEYSYDMTGEYCLEVKRSWLWLPWGISLFISILQW